ncbi:Protein phosphatase 2C [Penicillium atrosanguineum]|uniref:protein-serine/threonine phosphatase n=1 Tax=Penicillium atrosanguineum TaxID=1132637 RepID=A0A9W9PUQ3_9EURO|nr:alpha/beta hydrolase [Penicillium atrosanguineum]KAJ5132275.1 Protein phosphatase 2C [Penicillium atrosanguineum]KAJ5137513.1 Protein phosphatase 2C [Penicillium atrosanguineum]KAJ5289940.1 alpha/beta hydrolase [Penicillium atrosanguineum]KAJ5307764.1 Protein phosphatase 2C [Penicillium atrosanguineum]
MHRDTLMSTSDAVLLFDAGAGQAQGSRRFQEDRYVLIRPGRFPADTEDTLAYFSIYDGQFVARLQPLILAPSDLQCSGSGLVSEHATQNLHNLLAQRPELKKGEYAQAIKGALADEDALLLESFKYEYAKPAISGSTVALCLINLTQGELVCSNLGDSHVILAERDPKTEMPYHIRRLTQAHKPDTPDEQARIKEAGGTVEVRSGVPRLGSLNMSRALGDLQYKKPVNTVQEEDWIPGARRASSSSMPIRGDFLSNDPYTSRRTLRAGRRYLLVIVSDGVSDRTDDAGLIQHVMELSMRGMRASEIAQKVASDAARHPRSDNASCIVIMVDGQRS